jgi:hypothetical protein
MVFDMVALGECHLGRKQLVKKIQSQPKRSRNLMDNVYANQQNGKSHGDGH